jgi:hypothetical protein
MTDWTRITGATNTTGGGSNTVTLTISAVGSGNVIVGGILMGFTVFVQSVTDNQGNLYEITAESNDNNGGFPGLAAAGFRSLGLITNAPTSLTVTLTGTSTNFWVSYEEFQPPTGTTAICLDGTQIIVADTGSALPNMQTKNNDVLVWTVSFSTTLSTAPGTGFTAGMGSGTQQCTEWKIQATPSNAVTIAYASQTGSTWSVAFGIAPVAQTRWEPIQRRMQRTVTLATTGSISFTHAVTSGNIVVGTIAVDDVTKITSIVDDKSNNYILVPGTQANGRQIIWSGGRLTNSPTTITINLSVSSSVVFLQVVEFSPPPGISSIVVDTGSGVNTFDNVVGTTTSSPNLTTTANNDLLFSFGDFGGGTAKPTGGFCGCTGVDLTWEDAYFIQDTAGSISVTWNHGTTNTGGNNVSLAAFSPLSNIILMGQILT